jgi:hypothetical protein
MGAITASVLSMPLVYMAIFLFAMGVYAIWRLYSMGTPVFASVIPEAYRHMHWVHCAICPLIRLLFMWTELDMPLFMYIACACTGISMIAGAYLSDRKFGFSQKGLAMDDSVHIDVGQVTSTEHAIWMIRSGLHFGVRSIARKEFLAWICMWRFSPELLPDVIRLCLYLNMSLKELMIPRRCFAPQVMIGLEFLAFQVRLYELYYAQDGDPHVENACTELTQSYERAERLILNFWTDRDYHNLTIVQLSYELKAISEKFRAMSFTASRSQKVQELARRFTANIMLTDPDTEPAVHNPFELFDKDVNRVCYSSLKKVEPMREDRFPRPASSIDWYSNKWTGKTNRLLAFVVI